MPRKSKNQTQTTATETSGTTATAEKSQPQDAQTIENSVVLEPTAPAKSEGVLVIKQGTKRSKAQIAADEASGVRVIDANDKTQRTAAETLLGQLATEVRGRGVRSADNNRNYKSREVDGKTITMYAAVDQWHAGEPELAAMLKELRQLSAARTKSYKATGKDSPESIAAMAAQKDYETVYRAACQAKGVAHGGH